ncbi:MAG: chlorophyll a/b-binding protein [Cyanobacteria bacterium MAG CAR3_bin_5]|nr:chlorophyll a/b-binding protein [Cyanobacteria bacterium MAG CAR4_bin_6]MCY4174256.1 chlorophyll a/b-binding protein [Cyanobacteria bacterium MAG CAR3_bin_5]MCY4235668.1 chlorophyll a/b-binding protein [Cyanobacteria bacterium MAG CAR2_bin_4]MCY4332953.1 chlorophyll a/b-binding protein [Cyanobacteria bacterium MAG CAR1_bin_15]
MSQPDAPVAVDLGTPTAEPVSREELNRWKRGFTPQAEIWNGRLAMIGLSVAILMIVLLRPAS